MVGAARRRDDRFDSGPPQTNIGVSSRVTRTFSRSMPPIGLYAEPVAARHFEQWQFIAYVKASSTSYSVAPHSGPADRDWGMRTMTFADPGGHTWEIAQELPSAPGSS